MSVIVKIPESSRVRKPQVRFSAPFAGGFYDYNIAANENQSFTPQLKLDKESIYMIDRRSFAANLAEGVWLEGQLTITDFPRFILTKKKKPNISIYPEPERCQNYKYDAEETTWIETADKNDELLITFLGKIKQTASMNLAANIIIPISFTIYQISEPAWIDWFHSPYREIDPVGIFQK